MSDTLDWLSKVKPVKKSAVSFAEEEEEGAGAGGGVEGTDVSFNHHRQKSSSSIVPNLPKRAPKTYSGKDLHDLRVAHDLESFEAGRSEILVLGDSSILQAETAGDVLVSSAIREEERIKRLREIAKHAKGYSGFKAFEEEAVDETTTITLGGSSSSGSSRKANILQKYNFPAEFNNEPEAEKGFVLGDVVTRREGATAGSKAATAAAKASSVASQLAPVHDSSAGAEVIDLLKLRKSANKTGDLERERKRAKKLAKTLFADEPEMQVDAPVEEAQSNAAAAAMVLFGEEEEDDADLQRIISASRRENLVVNKPVVVIEPTTPEPLTLKGKSFDVIFTESIATDKSSSEVQQHLVSEEASAVKLMDVEEEESVGDFGGDKVSNADLTHSSIQEIEPIIAEPLVRNGVAATLALLNMRGISLKPRAYEEEFKASRSQIGADIKLEYYDDFGNKLTPKEAYKELSRRFHGKKAGKARIEKAITKRELATRIEKANASESVIVANLRKQQAEAGTPYVVLSSGRTQEAAAAAATLTPASPSGPVKHRKIFGLQVKK